MFFLSILLQHRLSSSANLQPTENALFKKRKCLIDIRQNHNVQDETMQQHCTLHSACLSATQNSPVIFLSISDLVSEISNCKQLHNLIKHEVTKLQLL